jgi:hypothetical protein
MESRSRGGTSKEGQLQRYPKKKTSTKYRVTTRESCIEGLRKGHSQSRCILAMQHLCIFDKLTAEEAQIATAPIEISESKGSKGWSHVFEGIKRTLF